MRYALRKLIAFVFLGGIFAFAYFDVANIFNREFQQLIATLIAVFGIFWLFIPWFVVSVRIRRRNAQNRADFIKWKDCHPNWTPRPMHPRSILPLERGETLYYHEKGTFYVESGTQYDEVSVPGRIGDVAFPKEHRRWRKVQRVHCYFTSNKLLFLGKTLDCEVERKFLGKVHTTPGGLVFDVASPQKTFRIAFTFHNPLIASEVLKSVFNEI